ncbi:MAG: CBS domain-containing protein [Deltaproteobacteria bacterium]|nr:CBS domain-containing protein [Deltaproteobacteria bacterium]
MLTVKDILSRKGRNPICIAPNKTIDGALRLMGANNVGALLVAENGELKGIFAERDYARKVALAGRGEDTTMVSEVMVTRFLFVTPGDTAEVCMNHMTRKRVRHLPVCEDGNLVGIISIGDVVKGVIEQHKATISYLEQYISGGYLPARHEMNAHRAAGEASHAAVE